MLDAILQPILLNYSCSSNDSTAVKSLISAMCDAESHYEIAIKFTVSKDTFSKKCYPLPIMPLAD